MVDVQVGLFLTTPPPWEADLVISRINAVTAKARDAGVPVVFVQHDGPPEGDWLVPHSNGWQFHADLVRTPRDLTIRKTTGDAFYRTDLESLLISRGIRSVLLMGYATDFCLDSTLRHAVSKDFEVFVVSDAHTTNDTPKLRAQEIREHFNWIWSDTSATRGIHVLKAEEIRIESTLVRS